MLSFKQTTWRIEKVERNNKQWPKIVQFKCKKYLEVAQWRHFTKHIPEVSNQFVSNKSGSKLHRASTNKLCTCDPSTLNITSEYEADSISSYKCYTLIKTSKQDVSKINLNISRWKCDDGCLIESSRNNTNIFHFTTKKRGTKSKKSWCKHK